MQENKPVIIVTLRLPVDLSETINASRQKRGTSRNNEIVDALYCAYQTRNNNQQQQTITGSDEQIAARTEGPLRWR